MFILDFFPKNVSYSSNINLTSSSRFVNDFDMLNKRLYSSKSFHSTKNDSKFYFDHVFVYF